jgi:hypothetical protein
VGRKGHLPQDKKMAGHFLLDGGLAGHLLLDRWVDKKIDSSKIMGRGLPFLIILSL